MADADREKMLRDMAANRGCKLVKSRRRTPGVGDYGRYGLKDAQSEREVFGFGADGLTATADDIEGFLRKGAISDWKISLAAAAGAANDERTPVPRARQKAAKQRPAERAKPKPQLRVVEPEPAPPPPPQPSPKPKLQVREARRSDAGALAALTGGDERTIARRVAALAKSGEAVLLAEEGGAVLGCCAWHVLPLLHEEAPLGRITFLLVAPAARRRGIGRALVDQARARLGGAGCRRVEAMAEIELGAAPDFFRRLGWDRSAYRYSVSADEG